MLDIASKQGQNRLPKIIKELEGGQSQILMKGELYCLSDAIIARIMITS